VIQKEKEQKSKIDGTYRDNATTIGEAINPNSINTRGTHLKKNAKKETCLTASASLSDCL
jgi:hypothetical protein